MATQSQEVPQAVSQQQSSPPKSPKRSFFTRSSSSNRRSKNKEIQSTPPPQINPDGQSPSSQSDNPPSAPSLSAPPVATTPSSSSSPPTTATNGLPKSDSANSNPSANSQQDPVPTTLQPPSNQAPTQLATTSSTTVASLPGNSTASAPAASEPTDDPDREKEKDKGSLSTTLTSTHPTRVSRKGAQSSSEGAHSSTAVEQPSSPKSAAKHKAPKTPSSPRVSFISRLLRFFVPCVAPSHLLNEASNEVVSDDPNSSATALREKSSARDAEKDSSLRPVQETPVTNDSVSEQPHASAELAPSTSGVIAESGPKLHVTPPSASTSDKDLDIIVPPTPTKVVPESETGGVTSSAVVPPGSTAEEVAHLRALQAHESSSGDESDGTSFTEDEEVEDVPGIDEAEDDEDRLILSGGAGIPIGPVSAMTFVV